MPLDPFDPASPLCASPPSAVRASDPMRAFFPEWAGTCLPCLHPGELHCHFRIPFLFLLVLSPSPCCCCGGVRPFMSPFSSRPCPGLPPVPRPQPAQAVDPRSVRVFVRAGPRASMHTAAPRVPLAPAAAAAVKQRKYVSTLDSRRFHGCHFHSSLSAGWACRRIFMPACASSTRLLS